MTQLGFFGAGRRTLVDDQTGAIAYIPEFVDSKTANAWFGALRDGIVWQRERRRMYDRDVDVPRLVARYRLDDDALPRALADAARRAESATGTPFNSVGLNYYRDGRDSVAPHNDHLYEIVEGFPIALISLGATRLMTIRSKAKPRRILDVDLEDGSLLVMSYETQLFYDHGIPKTRTATGPRISVALRVRP
ncbi:MAG: alpha-ketoglutarate-dependent dioxygenase AlkB [Candidatus Eremiobacteraeota bacterium]|nr:alpha-ketoglutarate-dependent dioxygenase AlkB [Candidatus Eremiobacteraeota bacterium]